MGSGYKFKVIGCYIKTGQHQCYTGVKQLLPATHNFFVFQFNGLANFLLSHQYQGRMLEKIGQKSHRFIL